MGGGTLLVPLLTFLNIPQKTVQAINLISFLPMCCVALIFHAKNKLLKTKNLGWVVFPASVSAIAGAFLAGEAENSVLRLCFAVFLISVGIWQFVLAVKFAAKQRRRMIVIYSSARCLKGRNIDKTTKKTPRKPT